MSQEGFRGVSAERLLFLVQVFPTAPYRYRPTGPTIIQNDARHVGLAFFYNSKFEFVLQGGTILHPKMYAVCEGNMNGLNNSDISAWRTNDIYVQLLSFERHYHATVIKTTLCEGAPYIQGIDQTRKESDSTICY